jgi:Na+-translocating ferredoxin:NAD+ oxidoreductase RnfG subunit
LYKHSLILLPVAAAAICQTAYATVYLSIEQAQALMFPQQTLTAISINPSAANIASIQRESGVRYYPGVIRAWRAADGYFFVDAVIGRHDLITYAVALTLDGHVRQVEILEYSEAYGGEIRNASWRKQFVGRSHSDAVQIGQDIQNISGATLSCQHVTDGIRRLLWLYAIVLSGH